MAREPHLPGRLGDPGMTLGTDPRVDPRLAAAAATVGLHEPPPASGVGADAPLEVIREMMAASEEGFGAVFSALFEGLPPIEGVNARTEVIRGVDDNDISLFIHEPADRVGALPAIVHTHGGGMVLGSATDPHYVRWRDELAAAGVVVVGVEFRNGGGKLGPFPFPAGLNDCASATRWVAEHRQRLGVDRIVVSGESGGGNLALATALLAKRQGWLDEIAGIYAQCPYISGSYADPPAELTSLFENDGYFLSGEMMAPLVRGYDPTGENATNPLAWPYHAGVEELAGLPPHAISVNELDPLRDEGLAYHRTLRSAGVSSVARVIAGTCHAGDQLFRAALPEVFAQSVRDVTGFAHSL